MTRQGARGRSSSGGHENLAPGCFSVQEAWAEDLCLQPQSLTEFCNYTFMLAEKENLGGRGGDKTQTENNQLRENWKAQAPMLI